MDATEALSAGGAGSEVDDGARNSGGVVTDSEGEIGQGSSAVEDIAAVIARISGAANRSIVGGDSGVAGEEEGGSGVSDTRVSTLGAGLTVHREGLGGVLPETVAAVDRGVGNVSRVLGRIGLSKIIGSISVLGEVGGEERRVQARLGVVKESRRLVRCHGVDAAECKTQKSVSGTRNEFGGDFLGKLNNLALDNSLSNGDSVSSNNSAGRGSIPVGNRPGLTTRSLVSRALA